MRKQAVLQEQEQEQEQEQQQQQQQQQQQEQEQEEHEQEQEQEQEEEEEEHAQKCDKKICGTMVTSCGMTRTSHCALHLRGRSCNKPSQPTKQQLQQHSVHYSRSDPTRTSQKLDPKKRREVHCFIAVRADLAAEQREYGLSMSSKDMFQTFTNHSWYCGWLRNPSKTWQIMNAESKPFSLQWDFFVGSTSTAAGFLPSLLWVVLHVDQGLPQRASQQHRHGPWGTWKVTPLRGRGIETPSFKWQVPQISTRKP